MKLLFWLLWLFNCLLTIFIVIAKGFRNSFTGSTDPTAWVTVLFIICLIASIVLRYVLQQPAWSWVMVLLPILLLLAWYVLDNLLQ